METHGLPIVTSLYDKQSYAAVRLWLQCSILSLKIIHTNISTLYTALSVA